jgi:hypothetical protein
MDQLSTVTKTKKGSCHWQRWGVAIYLPVCALNKGLFASFANFFFKYMAEYHCSGVRDCYFTNGQIH